MTTPFDAPDWRNMSQEERDLGLNNGVAVPGSAEHGRRLGAALAAMRKQYSDHLDLRYGPRERNRIDFLQGRRQSADAAVHPWRLLADPRQGSFSLFSPKARWRMASMSR